MSKFQKCKSYANLLKLAKEAPDLTREGLLDVNRIETHLLKNNSLKLLYGAQRVDSNILKSLFELAKEADAISKIKNMQHGKKVNVFENRAVLHTATRDFFDNRITDGLAYEASLFFEKEVEKLKNFLKEIEGRFDTLVQIGIGGSDLGPKSLYNALKSYKKSNKKIHFISNVDPDNAANVLKEIDLRKTLFVVVSKSGTTLETLTNEELVKSYLKEKSLDPKDHIVSVTSKGSPMDDSGKYLKSFYIKDYVGGRFSSTSMVGGVMLSFAYGIETYKELLKGANNIDKASMKNGENNIALMMALLGIWNRNFLKIPTMCIVPYSNELLSFVMHLQQCDMESNGKRVDFEKEVVDFGTSPVIWGQIGTDAQHSFFQNLHQGTDEFTLEFIGFKNSCNSVDLEVKSSTSQKKLLSNLFAQIIALAVGKKETDNNKSFPGNRSSSVLLLDKLTPYTLGQMLALYEHKIAFQGFIWDINSFDQEGVQLGKTLANKILKGEKFDLADALFKILNLDL
jgi:glucose-6-phosphate isomerase